MSVLPAFALHRPTSLAEALTLLSPDDLPYVGGTELLLAMRQRLLRPRSLISLRGLAELGEIRVEEDVVRIGAAVTHHRAARHEQVHARLPVLRSVLTRIGNPRVQAAGTLVGNLCFAEPKSDVIPLLIALEATLDVAGSEGSREVAVADFVVGPYATDREPDELVTSIRIPVVTDRRAVYLKFQTMERPTVGVAAVRADGARARVVVGAAGMMPVVAEGPLADIDPDAVAADIEPIADLTGSVAYKRHVTAVYVGRALRELQDGDD